MGLASCLSNLDVVYSTLHFMANMNIATPATRQ